MLKQLCSLHYLIVKIIQGTRILQSFLWPKLTQLALKEMRKWVKMP